MKTILSTILPYLLKLGISKFFTKKKELTLQERVREIINEVLVELEKRSIDDNNYVSISVSSIHYHTGDTETKLSFMAQVKGLEPIFISSLDEALYHFDKEKEAYIKSSTEKDETVS